MSNSEPDHSDEILDRILSARKIASAEGPDTARALQSILDEIPRMPPHANDYALDAAQFVAQRTEPGSGLHEHALSLASERQYPVHASPAKPEVIPQPAKYYKPRVSSSHIAKSLRVATKDAAGFDKGSPQHSSLMREILHYAYAHGSIAPADAHNIAASVVGRVDAGSPEAARAQKLMDRTPNPKPRRVAAPKPNVA